MRVGNGDINIANVRDIKYDKTSDVFTIVFIKDGASAVYKVGSGAENLDVFIGEVCSYIKSDRDEIIDSYLEAARQAGIDLLDPWQTPR